MSDAHAIVVDLKKIAKKLRRTPSEIDYGMLGQFSSIQIQYNFKSFQNALKAAGLFKDNKKKKWKYTPAKIDSINKYNVDLKDLFKKHGNPNALKMIAMPDTHVKYRDRDAVKCFLQFVSFYRPQIFMIMGDFIDAAGISHWPQDDLEPRRIVPEALEARMLLEELVKATPKATRLYLTGNHEDWIRQAMNGMPELFENISDLGIDIDLESMLDLKKYEFELFPVNHFVNIGKAWFTHGLYTGDNHPKKHFTTLGENLYYGHTHDIKSYVETGMHGTRENHALGCLCRKDPKFTRGKPTNWVHAFGIFEFLPSGDYNFMCPRIRDGKMSFMGKVFG